MNYKEFKHRYARLAQRRRLWVQAKAQWEHLSLWAVMTQYEIPASHQLRADGSWRP